MLKGYLNITITSQTVSSEAQVRIFLFCRKVKCRSQGIQVFVFLTMPQIYQICDVMMSISTRERMYF